MSKLTKPQRAALLWLRNRGWEGVFQKNQVLLAAGELAPVMRSTWNKLIELGYVENVPNQKRRIRVTTIGGGLDLRGIEESSAMPDDGDW